MRAILDAMGAFFGVILALAGIAALIWVLWWLWKREEEEEEVQAIEIPVEPPPAQEQVAVERAAEIEIPTEAAVAAETEAPTPDDLKRIEGIGPKISSVLQEGGIATFAQLAEAEVSQIEEILEAADPRLLRLADASTWPEQAALAAAGEWEALAALQDGLRGGRRA